MPNTLAVSLGPAAAVAVGGNGTAVDVGALRKAARLELLVTAITAGTDPRLTVGIEVSPDGSTGWRPIAAFAPAIGLSRSELVTGPLERFVRATWALQDITSVTFTVSGLAHVIYCEPKHMRGLGIKGQALDSVSDGDLVEFCIVASTEADGYLAKGYTLPLSAWDDDLRLHCAKIATYHRANARGRIPTGPDDIVDLGYTNAMRWLGGVGRGAIVPPGIVDTTPEVREYAYAVATEEPRGW